MLQSLHALDLIVLIGLLAGMVGIGVYLSLTQRDSEDYFLAGRSLRWWTVAGSVFGTNVNASHFIGMLGIGYSVGFAQSHYEVLALPAILVLCFVFLPLFRRLRVFTLSEFLEHRFGGGSRLVYTVLMITLIVVQLIAAFYIGSRTLVVLTAGTGYAVSYLQGLLLIGLLCCSYTLYGGLRAVAVTDTLQTGIMLAAGVIVAWFTFTQVEIGGLDGLLSLERALPEEVRRMRLYLPADHPDLPWPGVFTGLLVLQGFYWMTNQYLVQRTLAAVSDREAQIGVLAAGILKLAIPFLCVAAGVAAFHLFQARMPERTILPDDAFLHLVDTVVPAGFGLRGLILAGILAATFSTVDSMMNSVSTLLTVDLYRKWIRPDAGDREMLVFGRAMVLLMVTVCAGLALVSYDPRSAGNFFLRVSSAGGYFTQGVLTVFIAGFFWRKADARAAWITMVSAPVFAYGFEWAYNGWLGGQPAVAELFGERLNFLYRVAVTLLFSMTQFAWLSHRAEAGRGRTGRTGAVSMGEAGSGAAAGSVPDALIPEVPWKRIGGVLAILSVLVLTAMHVEPARGVLTAAAGLLGLAACVWRVNSADATGPAGSADEAGAGSRGVRWAAGVLTGAVFAILVGFS